MAAGPGSHCLERNHMIDFIFFMFFVFIGMAVLILAFTMILDYLDMEKKFKIWLKSKFFKNIED
jgi:hypothetical protein